MTEKMTEDEEEFFKRSYDEISGTVEMMLDQTNCDMNKVMAIASILQTQADAVLAICYGGDKVKAQKHKIKLMLAK